MAMWAAGGCNVWPCVSGYLSATLAPHEVSTMADRELIAAIILAGLLARNTSASSDDLAPSAIEAADKLRASLELSPKLTGPVGFTSQDDDEPPPGTP